MDDDDVLLCAPPQESPTGDGLVDDWADLSGKPRDIFMLGHEIPWRSGTFDPEAMAVYKLKVTRWGTTHCDVSVVGIVDSLYPKPTALVIPPGRIDHRVVPFYATPEDASKEMHRQVDTYFAKLCAEEEALIAQYEAIEMKLRAVWGRQRPFEGLGYQGVQDRRMAEERVARYRTYLASKGGTPEASRCTGEHGEPAV